MLNLLGEYPSTLDAKSRVLLPAALKKQLGGEESKGFVVNRDVFSECLVLYPMEEWNRTSAEVRRLNRFDPENVEFIRRFLNGATPLELDANGRLLIPKSLMVHARLENRQVALPTQALFVGPLQVFQKELANTPVL